MARRPSLNQIAAVILTACLVALPVMAAPPEGKGKPDKAQKHKDHKDHKQGIQGEDPLVSVSIDFEEARRIAIANGYTGYSELPPGIRKNLARGKPLPPGIAKKVVPDPMLEQLPAYPGYEWRIYGSNLVLVATATGIIADVIFGVFE